MVLRRLAQCKSNFQDNNTLFHAASLKLNSNLFVSILPPLHMLCWSEKYQHWQAKYMYMRKIQTSVGTCSSLCNAIEIEPQFKKAKKSQKIFHIQKINVSSIHTNTEILQYCKKRKKKGLHSDLLNQEFKWMTCHKSQWLEGLYMLHSMQKMCRTKLPLVAFGAFQVVCSHHRQTDVRNGSLQTV